MPRSEQTNGIPAQLRSPARAIAGRKRLLCSAFAGLAILTSGHSLLAATISQSLLMGFGSATAYNGTNDPAHTDQPGLSAFTTFQAVNASNFTSISGPTYANGTTATGVTISVSRATSAGGSVFASGSTANISNGGGSGTGIFGTALTDQDLESGVAGGDLGVSIAGLPAGQYAVYAVFPAGAQIGESGFKFSVGPNIDTLTSAGAQQFTTGTISNTTNWVGYTGGTWDNSSTGDNYVKATVTLATGQSLNAIDENIAFTGQYSKFAVLEVVPLPEPATAALLAIGALGLLARRRGM